MAQQQRTADRSGTRRAGPPRGPLAAAHAACEGLEDLTGHPAEGASAVRRTDEGWCVAVDVLEVARIPDTTSLLATYEVLLDESHGLLEFRRLRRYRRGTADA